MLRVSRWKKIAIIIPTYNLPTYFIKEIKTKKNWVHIIHMYGWKTYIFRSAYLPIVVVCVSVCVQAGDNHHFHPTCARCSKCGDPFGDGEEMFLQGAAIWHPRCGPAPREPGQPDTDHHTDQPDRASADLQVPSTSTLMPTYGRYLLHSRPRCNCLSVCVMWLRTHTHTSVVCCTVHVEPQILQTHILLLIPLY